MVLARLAATERPQSSDELLALVSQHLVLGAPASPVKTYGELLDHILTGETALLVDGMAQALTVETKSWEHRTITEPATEAVIRGPREGFNEVLRMNTALLRRRIKSPYLRLDPMKIGRLSLTDVVVAWIEGVTNPDLVAEVKRRLKSLDTDWIPDSGYLEQFIEDFPFSPFPQFQYTERPDRTAAAVLEGRVAIMIDGSPLALIVPGGVTSYLTTAEDYYERFPYGSLLRLLRLFGTVTALTLPALYIAITTFHQELIPTPLVLLFTASREPVPFPALVEALLMVGGLELTREAGLRLPAPIGQTVGIVAFMVVWFVISVLKLALLFLFTVATLTEVLGAADYRPFCVPAGLIVAFTAFLPDNFAALLQERLGRSGLQPVLDFLSREPQVRESLHLLVTSDSAADVLKVTLL